MRRGQLIVICGPEGAGKSTHGKLLTKYFGKKARFMEISFRHSLMNLVTHLYLHVGRARNVGNKQIPILPKDKVRLLLEMLSLLPQILRVKFFVLAGYIVVVEKYVPYTLACINYVFKDSTLRNFVVRFLCRLISDNNLLIMLDIDHETHINRRGGDCEPEEWICFQRKFYLRFAGFKNCIFINTKSINVAETQKMLRKIILAKLGELK